MAKQCEICGKQTLKAAKLTFSHKRIVHRQSPNLQTVKVATANGAKKMTVCSSCIKKLGKIQKAV